MNETSQYKVADISLADWGRKEIEVSEYEMPGLMACREKYGPQQPLAGVRITGSLHMTIQTAVLIQPGSKMPSNCSCAILKPVLPSFLSKILQKLVFLMSKQPEKNSSKSSALAFPCWLTFTPFIHTAVKINQAQNAFSMLNV